MIMTQLIDNINEDKKDISKPDYTNNILPLRQRLKIRNSNLI